jgi:hypothetical protein
MQERNRMLKSPLALRKTKAQVEAENKESGRSSALASTLGSRTVVRPASRAPNA